MPKSVGGVAALGARLGSGLRGGGDVLRRLAVGRPGPTRSLKMRGELTIAACSGWASGTLMTSIRKRAEFGSLSGASREQPGSSLGERTPADPET